MSDVTAVAQVSKPRPEIQELVASQVKRYVRFIASRRVPVPSDDIASEAWCCALVAVRRPGFSQDAAGAKAFVYQAISWGVGPQIARWLSPASLTKREAEHGVRVGVDSARYESPVDRATCEDVVSSCQLVSRLATLRGEYASERRKSKGTRRPGRLGILRDMIRELESEMS